MPRKRKSAPQRVDSSKRQLLSWDMADMRGDMQIVADDDPSLLLEQQHAEPLAPSSPSSSNNLQHDPVSLTTRCLDESVYQHLIKNARFYLNIYHSLADRKRDWTCNLAAFKLQLLEVPDGGLSFLQKHQQMFSKSLLYVNSNKEYLLYFEMKESETNGISGNNRAVCFRVKTDLPCACLEALQVKCFCLVLAQYQTDSATLELDIFLLDGARTKLKFRSEGFRPKKASQAMRLLFHHFYRIQIPDHKKALNKKHDIDHLYKITRELRMRNMTPLKVNVQHHSLKPRLRQYQKDAVVWMLNKESFNVKSLQLTGEEELHPLYTEVISKDGKPLYYNRHDGILVVEKPTFTVSPPGGILADEMGLGKTVEVLACMLSHPRSDLPDTGPLTSSVTTPANTDIDQSPLISSVNKDVDLHIKEELDTGQEDVNMELQSQPENTLEDLRDNGHSPLETCSSDNTIGNNNSDIALKEHDYAVSSDKRTNQILNSEDDDTVITTRDIELNCKDNFTSSTGVLQSSCVGIDCNVTSSDPASEIVIASSSTTISNVEVSCTTLTDEACSVIDVSSASTDSGTCPSITQKGCINDCCFTELNCSLPTNLSISCLGNTVEEPVDSTQMFLSVSNTGLDTSDWVEQLPFEKRTDCDLNVHYSPSSSASDLKLQGYPSCTATVKNTAILEDTCPVFVENGEDTFRDEISIMSDTCLGMEYRCNTLDEIGRAVSPDRSEENNSRSFEDKQQSDSQENIFSPCTSLEHLFPDDNSQPDKTVKPNSETHCSPVMDDIVEKKSNYKKSKSGKMKNRDVKKNVENNAEPEKREEEDEKKFECICGVTGPSCDNKTRVQCSTCAVWQHPDCVGYDLLDTGQGHYLCPHCLVANDPIASGATLIVSPNSICHQWVEEISKHIRENSIKVLIYTGVQKNGFMQPKTLASQDIVITTYETLRKEISYVDLPHTSGRRFRNPKRFMAIPSPLTAVQWWRICLDEAQMVECTTTKTAEMALRLSAVNRWCVTGTPIQRGIEDLYGLLLFLGLEPYWVHHWWSRLLYEPYCYGNQEPLHDVLSDTLWRTAKKDVLDQICLPLQTEEVHWLTFSPVEEHFYRRQYQDCAREAMLNLCKWTDSDTRLNSLDRYTLHQLLRPLLRLRQACCHPQAVRGEFLPIHKSTLTMEELLTQLIRKAQLECEESHRQCVAAMNGLAAIHIIKEQFPDAVEKYREALQSIEFHKDRVRTDELQKLHTIHNLQEVLALKPEGVGHTLRDSELQQQAEELKRKYMAKAASFVETSEKSWVTCRRSLQQSRQQFQEGMEWWSDLLSWVMHFNFDELLVEKVKVDLAENSGPGQAFVNKFRDVRGLLYLVALHLEQLQKAHDALESTILNLSGPPTPELVSKTVPCCLRPVADELRNCPYCKAHELFQDYENQLFSFVNKGLDEYIPQDAEDLVSMVSTRRQGTWADSELEKALKSLISFARAYGGDSELIEFGDLHIKIFATLKKEFRYLRTMWMALREQVSAVDELDMATTRFRLRLPDEEKSDLPQPNVIEPHELDGQVLRLQSDRTIGLNMMKKKLGQLLYLNNLKKAQGSLNQGVNPDPCPICHRELGTKWSVLQCGHCYCLECVQVLVDKYSFGGRHGSLRCPICRQRTMHADISYVSTKADTADSPAIAVKGDHSTKVEGVVGCLLQIQKDDPESKALVFSTWHDVLDVLAQALMENNIPYRSLHTPNKFQSSLHMFKHEPNVKVLLLPVHSGANGLNLIEATHVLLVEPILNPAQELQAIGRVHRIGQTKATVIHRFLVRGTIEERMQNLLRTVQTPSDSHSTDETTLTIGDLTSLFQDRILEEEDVEEQQGNIPENIQTPLAGPPSASSGSVHHTGLRLAEDDSSDKSSHVGTGSLETGQSSSSNHTMREENLDIPGTEAGNDVAFTEHAEAVHSSSNHNENNSTEGVEVELLDMENQTSRVGTLLSAQIGCDGDQNVSPSAKENSQDLSKSSLSMTDRSDKQASDNMCCVMVEASPSSTEIGLLDTGNHTCRVETVLIAQTGGDGDHNVSPSAKESSQDVSKPTLSITDHSNKQISENMCYSIVEPSDSNTEIELPETGNQTSRVGTLLSAQIGCNGDQNVRLSAKEKSQDLSKPSLSMTDHSDKEASENMCCVMVEPSASVTVSPVNLFSASQNSPEEERLETDNTHEDVGGTTLSVAHNDVCLTNTVTDSKPEDVAETMVP